MPGLLRGWWERTRPVHPETAAVLARRWAELPETARTPAQTLGRHAVGCEGTHGVFPRCNLTCSPCYHSADANRVRVDGEHTLAELRGQLGLLRRLRGPRAHTQLIGGEVTLLDPDTHAAALAIMREHGREPMSMTHGDVDYDYLRRLVLGPDGRRRLRKVSFAAHVDSLMRGRRGAPRPRTEAELAPFRRRFGEHFAQLRREHGVRAYLAHNMTVTPANVDQVAGVVRESRRMGYSMFSFQPAAYLGDDRRWSPGYRAVSADAVWAEVERGAGQRLSWRGVQLGDERCNRTAFGGYVGERWIALVDEDEPADLAARDAFYRHLGGINVSGSPVPLTVLRVARAMAGHPGTVPVVARWTRSMVRRAGGLGAVARALARRDVRPMTFVIHSFMDAAVVAPAWAAMRRGETATDPAVREAQERLGACSYAMAHPETGELVPACVQHSVLDPAENAALRRLLPLEPVRR